MTQQTNNNPNMGSAKFPPSCPHCGGDAVLYSADVPGRESPLMRWVCPMCELPHRFTECIEQPCCIDCPHRAHPAARGIAKNDAQPFYSFKEIAEMPGVIPGGETLIVSKPEEKSADDNVLVRRGMLTSVAQYIRDLESQLAALKKEKEEDDAKHADGKWALADEKWWRKNSP